MDKNLFEQIKKHAIECYPRECCGYINHNNQYIPVDNKLVEIDQFKFGINDLLKIQDIKILIHSHVEQEIHPSKCDLIAQDTLKKPFGIVGIRKENNYFKVTQPLIFGEKINSLDELMSKHYVWGASDCFSFVQDYYRIQYDIEFGLMPREYPYNENGLIVALNNFNRLGFYQIKININNINDLQIGDVAIIKYIGSGANHIHCLLYEGQNIVAHHTSQNMPIDYAAKPKREMLNKFLPSIKFWLRHKDIKCQV